MLVGAYALGKAQRVIAEARRTGDKTFQVNGNLELSTVQETVTVTGETPVVDVQSVKREIGAEVEDDNETAPSHSSTSVHQSANR